MITTELQSRADAFVAALETDKGISAFREAKLRFEENAELRKLRATYSERLHDLQQKQMLGTFTKADITDFRSLQEKINEHPATIAMLHAQESATEVLGECNETISAALGFDFSANAAAPGGCC